jgi:hypothetical protein
MRKKGGRVKKREQGGGLKPDAPYPIDTGARGGNARMEKIKAQKKVYP